MRHLTASQRGEDGPWHYVSMGRTGGYPTEGCTNSCDHQTAAEAFEHHRQWILDNLELAGVETDVQRRCEVCAEFTENRVHQRGYGATFVLCPAHATRDDVERLHFRPDQQLESWES